MSISLHCFSTEKEAACSGQPGTYLAHTLISGQIRLKTLYLLNITKSFAEHHKKVLLSITKCFVDLVSLRKYSQAVLVPAIFVLP